MYASPATFIQEAKELLDYDPSTGIFLWKVDRRYAVKAGDVAGCVQPSGYRYIQINRRAFRAPRLAWLFVHGVWPTHQIDHINGQKDDNRIANLRDVTAQQNSCNTVYRRAKTSAFTGVSKRRNGKWVAHLNRGNKSFAVGTFDSEEAAHQAYVAARDCYDAAVFTGAVQPVYQHQPYFAAKGLEA